MFLEYIFLLLSISSLAGLVVDRFLVKDIRIFLPALAMLCFSLFNYGKQVNDNEYKEKIKNLEDQVKLAEEKASVVTEKVVTEYVFKDRIVKEKAKEIVKYIDREVVKYDSKCEIPDEVVNILNEAAKKPE